MLLLLLACSLSHTLSQKLCHFLKFWWEKFIGNHCFIFQKKRYLPIGMYVLLELIWNLFDVSPFKMFIDLLDVAGLYMIGYGQEKIFWKSPLFEFWMRNFSARNSNEDKNTNTNTKKHRSVTANCNL